VAWFTGPDPQRPNDKEFLGRLQKLRVALHKAKHAAVAERIRDVLATGQKVIVFTAFTAGLRRHKAFSELTRPYEATSPTCARRRSRSYWPRTCYARTGRAHQPV